MNTKIYKEIAESGTITERQILTIKSRLNRGVNCWDDVFKNGPLGITPEQTEKGLNWLLNEYKTPSGKVRKSNPFGEREVEILENFKSFELVDFYNIGNFYPFYIPVYRVNSVGGSFFEYVCGNFGNGKRVKFIY